jgi:hypothetical protein
MSQSAGHADADAQTSIDEMGKAGKVGPLPRRCQEGKDGQCDGERCLMRDGGLQGEGGGMDGARSEARDDPPQAGSG